MELRDFFRHSRYFQHLLDSIDHIANQALIRKRIFLPGSTDGHLVINQKHKYHYQVQQLMFVTQKSWEDLVVKGVKYLPDRSLL